MGERGPKPQSADVQAARGNPGKRSGKATGPTLPIAEATPPKGLPPRARKEWERLAPDLIAAGVLTIGDLDLFETYVRLVDECAAMEARARRVGIQDALRLGYTGTLLKLRAQKKQHAAELGLTPSARAGVSTVPTDGKGEGKLARFGLVPGGATVTPISAAPSAAPRE